MSVGDGRVGGWGQPSVSVSVSVSVCAFACVIFWEKRKGFVM